MMQEIARSPIEILGSGAWTFFFRDLQRLVQAQFQSSPELRPTPIAPLFVCCGPLESFREDLITTLHHGHTVWLTTTHLWQPDEVDQVRQAIQQAREAPLLELISPRAFDIDYVHARRLIEQGQLGELQAIRSLAWTPPPVEQVASKESPAAWIEEILLAIEPALELCSQKLVACQFRGMPNDWAISLEFEGNLRAEIELRKHGHVPFATGWMVDGTLAGYRQGRIYRSAPDGETIDVPVAFAEPVPTATEALRDRLLAALLSTTGLTTTHREDASQQAIQKLQARLPVYQTISQQLPGISR